MIKEFFSLHYLWLLMPVFLVIFIFLHQKKPRVYFASKEIYFTKNTWRTFLNTALVYIRLACLIFIIIALTRPRGFDEIHKTKKEGIDIVLTLDCSGSMRAEDFVENGKRYNRLQAVKKVVREFIKARDSDRMSLVAFAVSPYILSPLTTDKDWLVTSLDRLDFGIIKDDATAVGSALAASLKRLQDSETKSKVVILLTDGVNNSGKTDPLQAAEIAKTLGIKVYTVGAGVEGLAPYPVVGFGGQKMYRQVQTDLDEETLKKIAETTGGLYFRAGNMEKLKEIYKQIDKLEKTKSEENIYRQYKEHYGLFAFLALAFLGLEVLIRTLILKRFF